MELSGLLPEDECRLEAERMAREALDIRRNALASLHLASVSHLVGRNGAAFACVALY